MTYPPLDGLALIQRKDETGKAIRTTAEKVTLGVCGVFAAWATIVASQKPKPKARPSSTVGQAEENLLRGRYRVSIDDAEAEEGRYGLAIQPKPSAASPYLTPTLAPSDLGLSAKYDPYWTEGGVGMAIPEETLEDLLRDLEEYHEQ
jgi:hypothetical protein